MTGRAALASSLRQPSGNRRVAESSIQTISRLGIGLGLAAVIALIVAYGLLGQVAVVEELVNSDSLLPAHLAWDVLHHTPAWQTFQWPRVISLPDIVFFLAAEALGVGWRHSHLAYSWLVTLALIAAIAAVVSRARAVAFHRAMLPAGLLVGLVLLLAGLAARVWPDQPIVWMPVLFGLIPVTHGNAFILSLLAARMALDDVDAKGWIGRTGLLACVLGAFSDILFFGYFLAPFWAALLVSAAIGTPAGGARSSTGSVAWVTIRRGLIWTVPCALGWLAQQGVYRQGFAELDLMPVAENVGRLVGALVFMPWLPLGIVLLIGVSLRNAILCRGKPCATNVERLWLATFGTVAALLSLLTIILFQGAEASARTHYTYRYLLPLMWWPFVLLLTTVRLPRPAPACGSLAILAALTLLLLPPVKAPAILTWRSLAEQCVDRHRADLGLSAGLAPYWTARTAMASSNWRTQIDQLSNNGTAYMWGNDVAAYRQDIHDRSRRPSYNFIIADDNLDAFELTIRYGAEDRRVSCGRGMELLVYGRTLDPIDADLRPQRKFDLLSGWRPTGSYD